MHRITAMWAPLFVTLSFGPALLYGQHTSTAGKQITRSDASENVLASVNGTTITDADVDLAMSKGGHSQAALPEHRKNILEVIIRRELVRQRAAELGLETNRSYQTTLRRMEAQINAFKREKLSELFWRKIAEHTDVSEAEAKNYFTQDAGRIRAEVHVWQILLRKESAIKQSLKEIKQGASFEKVARKSFPNLTEAAGQPWDLGYLKWTQVPKSWQNVVYGLKKGEVSGIIRGPNQRFWIIKLIDKREVADLTFESIKPIIIAQLKNAAIEERRATELRDLREKAEIVYTHHTFHEE